MAPLEGAGFFGGTKASVKRVHVSGNPGKADVVNTTTVPVAISPISSKANITAGGTTY